MTATAPTSPPAPIIEPTEEVRAELGALAKATSSRIVISSDDDLANVEGIRTRAKAVMKAIEAEYKGEKQKRHNAHTAICAEERFMLDGPAKVLEACESAMKPYLLKKEQERQAEQRRLQEAAQREAEERRRQEAETARREAEERARQEREAAEERARIELEAAQRQAEQIEREAMERAEQLSASGDEAGAMAAIDDAAQRKTNILEDAAETVETVKAQAEDVAARTEAEGALIAQEIEAAPVQRMHVAAAPPASAAMKSTGTSNTYKSDREKAVKARNKLQMLRHIVAEADRGNFAPLSWVDHNFKNIDASARQMEELFPPEEVSGLDVGLAIGLRSKKGTTT